MSTFSIASAPHSLFNDISLFTGKHACINALPVSRCFEAHPLLIQHIFVSADIGSQGDARTAKIKWKKLAKRAITAAGGRLKVKKLQKQLLQETEVLPPQHALAVEQLMMQLASSKQFTIAGSSVALTV